MRIISTIGIICIAVLLQADWKTINEIDVPIQESTVTVVTTDFVFDILIATGNKSCVHDYIYKTDTLQGLSGFTWITVRYDLCKKCGRIERYKETKIYKDVYVPQDDFDVEISSFYPSAPIKRSVPTSEIEVIIGE